MAESLVPTVLHGYYDGPFFLAWSFDPLVTTALLTAVFVYGWAWTRVRAQGQPQPPTWYAWAYFGGIATLALSLLGPFETYNEQLFTLHMTQHLIMMQISAPLILLGRPVQLVLRAMPRHRTKSVIGFFFGNRKPRYAVLALTTPLVAFFLFNVNMGVWHIPAFYEMAVQDTWVHHFQHALFAGFSLLYWWTIIDPVPRHHRVPEIWAIGSLFLSMMIGSVIGAVLTLSGSVLYPFYLEAANPWGWSAQVDQQVGGLLMWVGAFLLYFAAVIVLAVQLLQRDEAAADRQLARAAQEQAATTS